MSDQNSTNRPMRLLDIAALTLPEDEPGSALQYSVIDADGKRHIYGDQEWVRDGRAVEDAHPGGTVERRVLLITYGEWLPTVS